MRGGGATRCSPAASASGVSALRGGPAPRRPRRAGPGLPKPPAGHGRPGRLIRVGGFRRPAQATRSGGEQGGVALPGPGERAVREGALRGAVLAAPQRPLRLAGRAWCHWRARRRRPGMRGPGRRTADVAVVFRLGCRYRGMGLRPARRHGLGGRAHLGQPGGPGPPAPAEAVAEDRHRQQQEDGHRDADVDEQGSVQVLEACAAGAPGWAPGDAATGDDPALGTASDHARRRRERPGGVHGPGPGPVLLAAGVPEDGCSA